MRFEETLETSAKPRDAFIFASDFTNLSKWDPSIVSVRKLGKGDVREGTRFRVCLRFLGATSELDYRVRTYDAPRRAELVGEGTLVTAVDTVLVEPHEKGAKVRWIADIRFVPPLSLLDPVFQYFFSGTVSAAVAGLKRALNRLAQRERRRGSKSARAALIS